MADLTPLLPMGATTPREDTHNGVTLSEIGGTALASFAARLGKEDAARATLSDFLSDTPPAPGQATLSDTGAIWIAPDQWLIVGSEDTPGALAASLVTAAQGAASVTDQTGAWCRFDLKGAGLPAVFELLCPMNLRNAAPGAATRTSIHHLGCFVILRADDHVTVLGPRSSAQSLHHALITALHAAL